MTTGAEMYVLGRVIAMVLPYVFCWKAGRWAWKRYTPKTKPGRVAWGTTVVLGAIAVLGYMLSAGPAVVAYILT